MPFSPRKHLLASVARRWIDALLVVGLVGLGGCDFGRLNPGGAGADSPYEKIKRSRPREAAVRMQSRNYMQQIGIAMHSFHTVYGQFPIGESDHKNYPVQYRDGKPMLSWRVYLLPFLEAEPLYEKFKLDEPWDSPHNIQLLDQMPDQYKSLDYRGLGHRTTVLASSGPGSIFEPSDGMDPVPARRFNDLTDGESQVLMVVMAQPGKAVPWTQPADFDFNPDDPLDGLLVPGERFMALFADGSVYSIGSQLKPETLLKLFQYQDGGKIDFDALDW